MTKVHGSDDCGNSPKNRIVQEVAIALESGQPGPDIFSADVTWERPSAAPIAGREAVLAEVAARAAPSTITVEHAIAHGKVGAANGAVTFENGHRRRFCHVLEFATAKADRIRAITSYG